VFLELVWVLQANDCTASEIAKGLSLLLGHPNFKPEQAEAVRTAIHGFSQGMDFADALQGVEFLHVDPSHSALLKHLYLRPPKVLAIGGAAHQLEADALPISAEADAGSLPLAFLSNAAQTMLAQLQAPIQPEKEFMFTIDIPYVQIQDVQTMVVALAATGQAAVAAPQGPKISVPNTTGSNNVTIESCQDVMSLTPDSAVNSIPVLQGVLKSLGYSIKQIESGKVPTAVRESIKVTVIEPSPSLLKPKDVAFN